MLRPCSDNVQFATPWWPRFDMFITRHYMCIIQNNLIDLHNHVNNKISHACKSKVTCHGKVMSCKNAMSHENSTSFLLEIP